MKPISRYMQEEIVGSDTSLPLAVGVLGSASSIEKLSTVRLVAEVKSGAWDEYINNPQVGPNGQSLLLTLLGSQKAKMVDTFEEYRNPPPIANLAAALVKRGANPLSRDNDGRDSLDQAFAASEIELLSQWLGELSNPPVDLAARRITSGTTLRPSLPWLHQAALSDNHEMVDLLLDVGIPPDYADERGETALFWARSPHIVSRLLAKGANPAHRNLEKQDASVFWVATRKLPQQVLSVMRAELPRSAKNSLPRSVELADFYSQARTGGKGVLEPLLKKINLQPGEFDVDGFGPLGNLGSRMLDPSSSRASIDRKRTLAWAGTICSHSICKHASPEDLMHLWAGCCRFGGAVELQKLLGILDSAHVKTPGFWARAFSHLETVAIKGDSTGFVFAWDQANRSLQVVIERDGERASEIGPLLLSCLDKSFAARGHANAINLAVHQDGLLTTIKGNPQWNLDAHPQAWAAALHVDQTFQSKGHPLISLKLINHLLEVGTPYPDDMSARVSQALELCSGEELDQISRLARLILDDAAPKVRHTSSRPRL